MPLKRHYEVGESSKHHAMTNEAKARRQAYLEMWRNLRNQNREELGNPVPPPSLEESRSTTTLAPPNLEPLQSLDGDSEVNAEEGYLINRAREKVQFRWGKCVGMGLDPKEEDEEEEEDSEEGDLEEDPKDVPMGEQQGNNEKSEEDPEENFEEEVEEKLEEEEEVIIIEDDTKEEWEPMECSEEKEPWEILSDEDEILDEEVDEGIMDEPEAIERAPEEREVSDSEYQGFSSDDEL